MNTWFEKTTPFLATFRDISTSYFQLGWVNTQTHGQLDYIFVSDTWRNACKETHCIHETLLDSDDALILADMYVRFAAKHKRQTGKTMIPRFRLPSENERQQYNNLVQQNILSAKQQGSWNVVEGFEHLAGILIDAACANLPRISPRQKNIIYQNKLGKKLKKNKLRLVLVIGTRPSNLLWTYGSWLDKIGNEPWLRNWNALIAMATNGTVWKEVENLSSLIGSNLRISTGNWLMNKILQKQRLNILLMFNGHLLKITKLIPKEKNPYFWRNQTTCLIPHLLLMYLTQSWLLWRTTKHLGRMGAGPN